MKRSFVSGFADDLNHMIDLKNSLKFSEKTYLDRAQDFDRFCAENYPKADELMEPMVMNWLKQSTEKSDGSIHRKAAFARAFGRYQKSVGKAAYIIPESYTAGRNVFVPYILGDKELVGLFHVIDTYEKPSNPFEPVLLSVYFRLTYTCGLRPNEGRNLKRSEVDLNTGEVRIVNTKWHKSRTVVMSGDMHALAKKYTAVRDVAFPDSEYFFPKADGGPYTATCLGNKFRKFFALSNPGIPAELLPSVRVYDLRHRFATAVLNQWLDEKIDLNARLPYLQTFMGHKEMESTAYYIHLLPENLVKSAGIDWESMNRLLPRVELWEK